jgi:CRISPR-associated endonuclease/helicase Cas3
MAVGGVVPPILAAHSPSPRGGGWHPLSTHLEATGQRASAFGELFESASACGLVGLLHDIGKADPAWQEYLSAAAAGLEHSRVDHKHAAAFLLHNWGLGSLAYVVAGHHGGLPDHTDLRSVLDVGPTPGQTAAIEAVIRELGLRAPDDRAALIPPRFRHSQDLAGLRQLELWLRFVFSALIDADRLDTEAHFRPGLRPDTVVVPIGDLDARCVRRRAAAVAGRQQDPVAAGRAGMFEEVMSHAGGPRGWFELNAPTGSGKTIAALSFALRHASANGQRRVVAAVPFISVTEQVAGVYRELLNSRDGEAAAPVVLEHHSGLVTESDSGGGAALWSRLAAENWDAPVVVTTTVQLLESLFHNSPTRARKLHRLAGSVLVLDEVQSIPWRLLEPTLEVLRELVRNYGCSVVLSTATQPPFTQIGDADGTPARQLASRKWFEVFDRTSVQTVPNPLPWKAFAERVSTESDRCGGQCLVVVNTIADARELCGHLEDRRGLVYLSTRLCQAHRVDVLTGVIAALDRGHPCTLVSTQLVEAGIDIDFPVAVRAFGPIPAVAQVAGRVNRHGLRDRGTLVLIDPAEGHVPPEEYALGTAIGRQLLRAGAEPLDPDTIAVYYERLLHAASDKLDTRGIQRDRAALKFKTVARNYRLIADDTTPVLVAYGDFVPDRLIVPEDPGQRRRLLRSVQRYTVSLRAREFQRCQEAGLIEERSAGVWIWHGRYDARWGLVTDRNVEEAIW